MYSLIDRDDKKRGVNKKQEELIKMLLKTKNKNNVLLCLIKK